MLVPSVKEPVSRKNALARPSRLWIHLVAIAAKIILGIAKNHALQEPLNVVVTELKRSVVSVENSALLMTGSKSMASVSISRHLSAQLKLNKH
jgi:hypothetical protein